MKYIIYDDLAMTKVRKEVDTDNRQIIAAIHNEIRANGVLHIERLPVPYRVESVGIVVTEF